MFRLLSTFCISLVVLLPALGADVKKVIIRWHGQSFFEMETSKGTKIVFDPHMIEEYGRKMVKADLVLISHFHNDHTQVDVVENRDKAKIINGLKPSAKRVEWNLVDEKFRDIRVSTVGAYHDTMQGMERGKNTIFIVEADGMRFVFLGDLGHKLTDAQAKAIGAVDVLMIPVGGVYTLNGADAKEVVAQLKPKKYIIPMHYGTKVYEDLLPPDEFLEDQLNVKKYAGNRLDVESDFTPKEPQIAVLNSK